MKRILFFAAATAIAMSSCSKNEILSTAEDAPQAIGFGTYVGGASTKATAKEQFIVGDKFGVLGYYTEEKLYAAYTNPTPNFMYNEDILAGGVATALTWSYAPVKYWPNGVTSGNLLPGRISFFAYWPMADAATNGLVLSANTATGDPKVTYTLDQTKAVDLMWGVEETSGKPYLDQKKQVKTDNIKFTFKHALARVGFQFQLADDIVAASTDETTVTIDKVEFGGTISGETFTSTLTGKANLNLNNTTPNVPEWEAITGAPTVNLTLNTADFTYGGVFALTEVADTSAAFSGGVINNKDGNFFMVIPQNLGASKMRVTYTVSTKDEDAYGVGATVDVKNIFTIDLKDFVGGKAYLYNMTIGLNSVKITGESTDWVDATENYTIQNSTTVTPKKL